MVRGWAMSLRQASQAASMISSSVLKTRFESQVWRRYCQMFSTGFSSGARDGSRMMVMFFGMLRAPVSGFAALLKRHPALIGVACVRRIVGDGVGSTFLGGQRPIFKTRI